jgi:hypothetical protein
MEMLNNLRSNIRFKLEDLSQDTFKSLFVRIDQLGVKQGVDKMGLDRYVEQCARLAATTGAISGGGGVLTMAIGIPIDLLNMITQQFRVTLGIIYYYRGSYNMNFDEFISILAAVFQVEAGVTITKAIMERIAEKMMVRLGSKTAGRLIPVVGAVIGGTTNYMFIKRVADSVKKLHRNYASLTIHVD